MAWENWNKSAGEIPRTALQAIRAKCIDCCCGSIYEPMKCTVIECPLYAYRDGHNPHLKGKSSNSSIIEFNKKQARERRAPRGENE